VKKTAKLADLQALLRRSGPKVPVAAMRVTHYED
jgi:hypothetical protein